MAEVRGSSSSAARRARGGRSCASRCAGSSSGARRGRRATSTRSREELRVKEVGFGDGRGVQLRVSRTCRCSGRSSASELGAVRAALQAGEFEQLPTAASASPGTSSSPTRCSSSGARGRAGRSPRTTALTVALDTTLDDELRARGPRARPDPPRSTRCARTPGLELTDRIVAHAAAGRRATCSRTRTGSSEETLAVRDPRRTATREPRSQRPGRHRSALSGSESADARYPDDAFVAGVAMDVGCYGRERSIARLALRARGRRELVPARPRDYERWLTRSDDHDREARHPRSTRGAVPVSSRASSCRVRDSTPRPLRTPLRRTTGTRAASTASELETLATASDARPSGAARPEAFARRDRDPVLRRGDAPP